ANGDPLADQPDNGMPLSLPSSEVVTQRPYPPVALALDGTGGAFAFTLGSNGNLRAFHVLSPGFEDPLWPAGALVVAPGAPLPSVFLNEGDENWPVAVGDLAGNAWVGWRSPTDPLLVATRVQLDRTISPGWTSPVTLSGEMQVTLAGNGAGIY